MTRDDKFLVGAGVIAALFLGALEVAVHAPAPQPPPNVIAVECEYGNLYWIDPWRCGEMVVGPKEGRLR